MAGYATNFPFDGTAAMKPIGKVGTANAKIIAFPTETGERSYRENDARGFKALRNRVFAWVRSCLLASEMFCSLKWEDARGVAYKLFSNANIGALAFASFVVAVLSIAYGA